MLGLDRASSKNVAVTATAKRNLLQIPYKQQKYFHTCPSSLKEGFTGEADLSLIHHFLDRALPVFAASLAFFSRKALATERY